jgi:hypothetical protein
LSQEMTGNLKTDFPLVLYIMGTGRSGTTMLEIMLSVNDDVCGVGELTHIFRDGFEGDKTCACGQAFSQCAFWSQIQQRLSYPFRQVLQFSDLLNRIDWHKGFLKTLFHAFSKKKTKAYARINKELYTACADVSGRRVIVDSSKYPGRALMLSRLYGSAVKIICLTRSAEGLLNAFLKTDVEQPSKSPFAVLVYYVYVLLCCRIVALATNNVLFITFEELTAFPVKTIKKIEAFTGITFEQTRRRLENNAALTPGHIVTGNRLRNNKTIFFQKQQGEQKLIPKRHNLFLFLMKVSKKLLGF